jgi:hypothetical protein
MPVGSDFEVQSAFVETAVAVTVFKSSPSPPLQQLRGRNEERWASFGL